MGKVRQRNVLGKITIQQIRALYDRRPFRPFIIRLADGREVPVKSPEFIHSAPSGRTIVVYQPDDTMHIIDLLLVTELEVKTTNGAARKRRE